MTHLCYFFLDQNAIRSFCWLGKEQNTSTTMFHLPASLDRNAMNLLSHTDQCINRPHTWRDL
jgi:hypothetical protein